MSILIRGMEMPKNCYQCRMVDSCQYLWKPYDLDDYSDLQNMVEEGFTRADNCPLAEVPPHGRLIDETDVINHFVELANDPWNQNVCTSWSNAFAEAAGDICDMPTIIEAEEGE